MWAKLHIFMQSITQKQEKSWSHGKKYIPCARKATFQTHMKDFFHRFCILFVLIVSIFSTGPVGAQILFTQQGNASYYADQFHGRLMANGKVYHRDSMTCAHLRYPLGTKLLVRNLVNGREVVVTVTDRGPYSRKFVIDLSRAAARQLGIIQIGFQQVEIIPFIASKIPYRYEPPTERPELDLGYTTDVDLGPPVWQDDSIYMARHRLSRTAVVQAYRDSLATTLREDTTLRETAIRASKRTPHASGVASGKSRKRR